jgi:hypothetical protein
MAKNGLARVLDVASSEEDGIRLHESVTITDPNVHQQPEEGLYIALSYSWSTKPILKLLKSNIDVMKQGVIDCETLSDIPKCHQLDKKPRSKVLVDRRPLHYSGYGLFI